MSTYVYLCLHVYGWCRNWAHLGVRFVVDCHFDLVLLALVSAKTLHTLVRQRALVARQVAPRVFLAFRFAAACARRAGVAGVARAARSKVTNSVLRCGVALQCVLVLEQLTTSVAATVLGKRHHGAVVSTGDCVAAKKACLFLLAVALVAHLRAEKIVLHLHVQEEGMAIGVVSIAVEAVGAGCFQRRFSKQHLRAHFRTAHALALRRTQTTLAHLAPLLHQEVVEHPGPFRVALALRRLRLHRHHFLHNCHRHFLDRATTRKGLRGLRLRLRLRLRCCRRGFSRTCVIHGVLVIPVIPGVHGVHVEQQKIR